MRKLFRKYLDMFGYTDTIIPGIIGNQSFSRFRKFGNAFGYINYVAMVAAMTDLAACSVKRWMSAGCTTIESHMQTYRSATGYLMW